MNKKNIAVICLFLLVFLAIFQIIFSTRGVGYGSKLAFLESAISAEELKQEKLTFQISQKTELKGLEEYAKAKHFVKNGRTLVWSADNSYAYNW